MTIFDHLEELRQRIFVSVLAIGAAILGCFAFSKELILVLEAPVKEQGVRFLQLAPGEFFFTTLKVECIKCPSYVGDQEFIFVGTKGNYLHIKRIGGLLLQPLVE